MIRLGNMILNDELIITAANSAIGLEITFLGGDYTLVREATLADLDGALVMAGALQPADPADIQPRAVTLTDDDIKELASLRDAGYTMIAADSTGQIYAYDRLPQKGARTWVNCHIEGRAKRCFCGHPVDWLSWDDGYPIIIRALLDRGEVVYAR